MKKVVLLLVAVLMSVLATRAENVVSLSSVRGAPNEEVTVSVSLQNSDAVAALQLSIPLDESLTLVEGSATLGSRASSHQTTVGVKDGVLNVMVYSLSMTALGGTSGEVVRFKLKLGKEPKDIALAPSKTMLTQSNGQSTTATCQNGEVSIRTTKAQYGNMEVDFGHVPIRDTYTQTVSVTNVGNEPLTITALNFSDVNVFSSTTSFPLIIAAGDTEELNVTYKPTERGSVERTMQVVCNNISKLNTITLKADPFAVNELHVQDAEGVSDEETTIHLTMNNMDDITGFQFEFALPDALKYVDGSFSLSDRKADHTVLATLNEGVLRAISYSSTNAAFSGKDGEIASFKVKLSGRNGVTLKALKAVLTAQIKGVTTDVLSAHYGGHVNISSPHINAGRSMNFGAVSVTDACEKTFTIKNNGNAPLTVSRIVFDNENLAVKEAMPLVVPTNGSKDVTVVYGSVEQKPFDATMQIYCNDPEQRLWNVKVTGSRFAPNYMEIETADIFVEDMLTIDVSLNTYDPITGLQFDVTYPHEVYEPFDGNVSLEARAQGMTVTAREVATGTLRYFCYFLDGNGIAAGSGKAFSIKMKPVGEEAPEGQYGVSIKNIKLGTSEMADKYAGMDVESTFKVKKHTPVTLTARSYTRNYGEVNPTFGYTAEGATVEGTPDITCEATATSPVGTYPIVISKGSVTNEDDSYVNGTLTVTKAPLTITAQSYVIKQGEELPTFEVSYDGFKNTDTRDVLKKQPAAACAATSWSDAGTYDITVDGAEAENYSISYVKGTLTIVEADPFTLTYKVDGKTYKTVEVKYGAAITPEAAPTKEGHTFSGWSEIPETMPAKDVIVTGSFTVNKYNLTYKVDGETYKTAEVEYGSTITPETAPTKEGYTFSGWSEIPETMPAMDVTVTGSFSKGEYQLTYIVDGKVYKTIRMDYGNDITAEIAPEKDGYTFSGWSEIPATMPAKDVTVTGNFTVNKYTLTYKVDGKTYKTAEVEYGATITAETAPTKEGYTFSGWSEIPETMPAKDVIIMGSFTVNKYTLTYKVDGDTYKTAEVEYCADITPEQAPTKEGYTFSGWSEIPETMPAKDVIVTGSFTVNKYNLTYKVDGETYKTADVEYGADITPETAPTKEGYTFSGWSEIPETMPAKDVTVTGSFTLIDAIGDVIADDGTYQIYTVDGKPVEALQKGVNIIKYQNGTTKKVMVK